MSLIRAQENRHKMTPAPGKMGKSRIFTKQASIRAQFEGARERVGW